VDFGRELGVAAAAASIRIVRRRCPASGPRVGDKRGRDSLTKARGVGRIEKPRNTVRMRFSTTESGRFSARMAELADALDSGSSGLTALEVRVLFRAPLI
jgi:hypothetical protein